MSQCEICGDKLASSIDGYKNHYKRFHGGLSVIEPSTIRPTRHTNRSKREIVHDIEKMIGWAIIPPVKPWHLLGDR